jgi:hypothetical protein
MYGGRGAGGVVVGGGAGVGGLAATGVPIMLTILLAVALVAGGLLFLRWGTLRRGRES